MKKYQTSVIPAYRVRLRDYTSDDGGSEASITAWYGGGCGPEFYEVYRFRKGKSKWRLFAKWREAKAAYKKAKGEATE